MILASILPPKLEAQKVVAPTLGTHFLQDMARMAPRAPQERPKSAPRAPKSAPRAPRSAPRAAKSAPRAPKSVPRAAKIDPRMPKSAPRASKITPRAQKPPKTRENMQNHAKPHKNAQKHTKHTQKHKRTHNDDMSRVFGFGCDGGFDCGSCLGWTKHAGHVIPFAVQPMQEPQSKAISQPKPKNRDMSSCCVGATLPYLSRLRGGISKAVSQDAFKSNVARQRSP